MATAEELNRSRGGVYGPFLDNGIMSQAIKESMRASPKWQELRDDTKEALDLIALKMSRIVTGNSHDYLDNWDDIGGYARAVSERIRNEIPRTYVVPQSIVEKMPGNAGGGELL